MENKTFSVNLNIDEWFFILTELEARRNNDLEPAVDNGDDGIKPLLNMSKRITKKIENKNRSVDALKKENKKLKEQIDKQHEEIQVIKNKLKDILPWLS